MVNMPNYGWVFYFNKKTEEDVRGVERKYGHDNRKCQKKEMRVNLIFPM